MDLTAYDIILVNTSAGKDSQAMMDYLVELADAQGVARHRLVAVHADLGRVEWKGTKELAAEQAAHYGLRFEAISRPQGDLLDQVLQRGMWPSSKQRYCTSDQKRGQIAKVMTMLAKEHKAAGNTQAVKILNCLGFRAEESPARAKKSSFQLNERATGKGKSKVVHDYLPIFTWTEQDVWARIRQSGVKHHVAYDYGMPRLSCIFCIFASRSALMIAGEHNPELLAEYVRIEKQIDHTFKQGMAIKEIQLALAAGEEAPAVAQGWNV